jgi:hypothetical protein
MERIEVGKEFKLVGAAELKASCYSAMQLWVDGEDSELRSAENETQL